MNAHALGILEFPRLLAHVAGRASSSPGAAAVRALAPRNDREWIEREHARVGAVRALATSDLGWPAEPIPDLGDALKRLRIAGLMWSALELLQGAVLLRSSRRMRETLRDPRRSAIPLAYLTAYAQALVDLRAQEDAIGRAISDDGTVRDEASPTLRHVRRELRKAEGELVRLLEREMGKLEPHHQVSDLSVTMRNGRWVIPMRREAKGYVGGIVHDSSGTGATIFVEPPAAVEFGNRVRELEIEEQREVERVLRELTESLHPYHDAIVGAFDALVALDSLYARARYSLEANCAAVAFCAPAEGLSIVDGRHPLLLAKGTAVVPFDLTLHANERTLLVSGPNTGGKTVLLKAIGLLCMMAQAGVPAPVGAMSRLPVFDDLFADVGDEQSIEASLSTFSAHLKNLGEILRSATPASLVLIDELGSGTDPAEGAALGGSILETLTVRGTLTLSTTHLGQLKLLATDVVGVVNASLQFDAVQLAPTYRLLKGVPGRSYGLSIARRLQLPEAVIARAEARLPQGERDLAVLLADVEARETVLTEREQLMTRENDKLRSRLATVSDRELKVRERERDAERTARQEARKYLLDARGQVERAIAEIRATAAAQSEFDETARAARRRIEEAAASQGAEADAVAQRGARDRARAEQKTRGPAGAAQAAPSGGRATRDVPLAEGDHVLVGTLSDKVGRILSLRGTEARVAVGSLTVNVPLTTLSRTQATPAPTLKLTLGEFAEVEPVREVDVRGMRVDEVDDSVLQALDAAVRNDLRELRIIHGKGTGALRARVGEMLKKDTRVTGFRLGAWNEGGAGVTVAELA
ncbi:endonuclease MutS2 [Gemmatimonas sp.]|uniref:endonuclease MutS2 n=1 Tax=Gemmatimonas sp. TaxID=1962908 RepID=UPI0027B9A424|nr:Smr/MutS family protein [Gemmatimonas sp.]